jgi:predicted Ser/Thr protein kinase
MSSRSEPGIDVSGATLASKPTPAAAVAIGETGADPTLAADGSPGKTRPGDLAELEPGTVIARYRIVSRLGAGGMGVVYRAHDAQLDREVALKLLRVGEDGTEGRTRMLREAKAAAKIRHPNVVTVYDAGEVFGRVFIAMELIDGVTLKAYFRGRKRGWREVVEVMLGAGEGLAAAHQAGLVHRDFKPDNVLVEAGGRVRVLDFGLARPASDADPTVQPSNLVSAAGPPVLRTLTQTGMLVGTPAYMAPEQHLAHAVDARTDQFAYCVSFYECLYGQRPFAGDTQASLTVNVLEGRLQAPRDRGDTPAEIFTLLQRGLAVAPAERYPALVDLLTRLRALLLEHERRPARQRLIGAAVLVPLLAAGAAVALYEHEVVVPAASGEPETPVIVPVATSDGATTANGGTVPPVAVIEPPKRTHVPIGPVRIVNGSELARLIAGILPAGVEAEFAADNLQLAGAGAAAWRDMATGLLLVIDADLSRRPASPSISQTKTPAGLCGVYLLDAKELPLVAAIQATPGVTRVSTSQALRIALVLGDGPAQTAVERLLREARAPKFREWCFVNSKNQDKKDCKPTRAQCEEDGFSWLGVKVRCDGRY